MGSGQRRIASRVEFALVGTVAVALLLYAEGCRVPDIQKLLSSIPSSSSCSAGQGMSYSGASVAGAASSRAEAALAVQRSQLGALLEQYSQADSASASALGDQLAGLARRRAAALAQLSLRDPAAALRQALSARDRERFPAAARACLESEVQLEGVARVLGFTWDPDSAIGPPHRSFLEATDGKRYLLSFANPASRLRSGEAAHVTGMRIPCAADPGAAHPGAADPQTEGLSFSDPVVVESRVASALQANAVLPNTFGAQSTAVILISFSNKDNTSTAANARDVVFSQVDAFWRETSYQQTWLTGQVFGPYTISLSSQACDPDTLASQARAAAKRAGVNLGQYSHRVYVFPKNACSWLGLGTVGGVPSEAWINASLQLHTVAHELGHNLGLYHAKAWDCGSSSILSGSCSELEYGDTTDVMGNLVAGEYTAYQKEQLGWLGYGSSPAITTLAASGDYAIAPLETSDASVKALKIRRAADRFYYLEYRQPIGYDSVFASLYGPTNLASGVVVHLGSDTDPDSSLLLNMNPTQGSWYEAALDPGQTYEDSDAGVSITLSSVSSSGAWVHVDLADPAASPQPLAAKLVASAQSLARGQGLLLSLQALRGSNPVAGAAYSLSLLQPDGGVSTQEGVLGSTGAAQLQFASSSCSETGSYRALLVIRDPASPSESAAASAEIQLN